MNRETIEQLANSKEQFVDAKIKKFGNSEPVTWRLKGLQKSFLSLIDHLTTSS